jgi:hypothetical protein
MTRKKWNFRREQVSLTLDCEMMAVIRAFKTASMMSLSEMIEELLLIGLKSKFVAMESVAKFEEKVKCEEEIVQCQ